MPSYRDKKEGIKKKLTPPGSQTILILSRNDSDLEMMIRDSIIKKMREKGLKLTPQRLAIVDVLVEKTPLHPSASMVYREVKKQTRGISLSTVYATLNELSRQGIVKMLEFDRMENRFEGNLTDHINLICKGCGKIMDFQSPISIDPKEIGRKAHFSVTDTRLEFYGYCRECRKK